MDRPEQRLWSAWAALALSIALGGGCSHTHQQAPKDPLLETPHPVDPAHPPPAPAKDQRQGAAAVPPLPPTLSATDNASLASNVSLPGGRPLAIGDSAAPATLSNNLKSSPAPAANTAPPATPLPRAIPVPDDSGASAAPGQGFQTAGSWSAGGVTAAAATPAAEAPAGLTTKTFATELAKRGFELQHLKQSSLENSTHVLCLASANGSADQSTFEVTAANFDEAAQAILREADSRARR
jgi:hypothetical protein